MSIKQTEEQWGKNIKFKRIACTHWVGALLRCQNGKRRVTRFGIFCVSRAQTCLCELFKLRFVK